MEPGVTMKISTCGTLIVLLLSPYIFGFVPNPEDSSFTSVDFAYGVGSYNVVSRDCNGNITSVREIPYSEYAVGAAHQFSNFKLGIAAGTTSSYRKHAVAQEDEKPQVSYVRPTVGLHFQSFGIDLGYLIPLNDEADRSPYGGTDGKQGAFNTIAVRYGRLDRVHGTLSAGANTPLTTGGGLIDVGIGFPLGSPRSRVWLGLGTYPWDAPAFSAKADIPVMEHFDLTLRGQVGIGSQEPEYGFSIGGRIIF
jgi:hypothetical protein